jgi:hypothetical protein
MGAGTDTDGDGIPNVEWPEEPAEEFENVAIYPEGWETNFKLLVDNAINLQGMANQQYMRFVEDQHTLLMRTADSNALIQNRAAQNAATVDHQHNVNAVTLDLLIKSGEVDTTAQGIAGLKLSDAFQDVAQQAVKAAVAAVPGTSAASQGTTGVAQGAMQTGAGVSVADLVTQVSKLAGLVDVIAAKVLGEEVTKVK